MLRLQNPTIRSISAYKYFTSAKYNRHVYDSLILEMANLMQLYGYKTYATCTKDHWRLHSSARDNQVQITWWHTYLAIDVLQNLQRLSLYLLINRADDSLDGALNIVNPRLQRTWALFRVCVKLCKVGSGLKHKGVHKAEILQVRFLRLQAEQHLGEIMNGNALM